MEENVPIHLQTIYGGALLKSLWETIDRWYITTGMFHSAIFRFYKIDSIEQ